MAKFASSGKATNTTAETILALTALSGTARRVKWAYFTIGSDGTPGDNAYEYVINRCSTAPTGGTSPLPAALDSGDSLAAATVTWLNPTAEGTVGTELFKTAVNSRATFQWYAAPGYELVTPATAANGASLETATVTGSSLSTCVTIHFEEC